MIQSMFTPTRIFKNLFVNHVNEWLLLFIACSLVLFMFKRFLDSIFSVNVNLSYDQFFFCCCSRNVGFTINSHSLSASNSRRFRFFFIWMEKVFFHISRKHFLRELLKEAGRDGVVTEMYILSVFVRFWNF